MQRWIPSLLIALVLSACAAPRKAQRRCDRAYRHMSKAAWLCADIIKADSVKVLFTVPGDSAKGAIDFKAPVNDDSLRAVIAQLSEALDSERELYAIALQKNPDTVFVPGPAVERIVTKVRERLCDFGELEVEDPSLSLHIWYDYVDGRIRYEVECKQKVIEQQIATGPVLDMGAAREAAKAPVRSPWWKWLLIVLILITGALLLFRWNKTHDGINRNDPRS